LEREKKVSGGRVGDFPVPSYSFTSGGEKRESEGEKEKRTWIAFFLIAKKRKKKNKKKGGGREQTGADSRRTTRERRTRGKGEGHLNTSTVCGPGKRKKGERRKKGKRKKTSFIPMPLRGGRGDDKREGGGREKKDPGRTELSTKKIGGCVKRKIRKKKEGSSRLPPNSSRRSQQKEIREKVAQKRGAPTKPFRKRKKKGEGEENLPPPSLRLQKGKENIF